MAGRSSHLTAAAAGLRCSCLLQCWLLWRKSHRPAGALAAQKAHGVLLALQLLRAPNLLACGRAAHPTQHTRCYSTIMLLGMPYTWALTAVVLLLIAN